MTPQLRASSYAPPVAPADALERAQALVGRRVIAGTPGENARGVLVDVQLAVREREESWSYLWPFGVMLRRDTCGVRDFLWLPEANIDVVPSAGRYNDEDAYTENDGFDRRVIRVECPHCDRAFAALCSPLTVETGGGWRWAGCDHREPCTDWRTTCGQCRGEFTFTTYTPQ